MIITTDTYEQIRKLYYHEGLSKREIAKVLGISRNTVAKYFDGAAVPWERQPYNQRLAQVMTDSVRTFIRGCLDQDEKENLPKQKHTARRIYDRLIAEMSFSGGESTVRRIVREIRDAAPKTFLPLDFRPAEAIQIDWGEATIYLKGQRMKVQLFCMRLCYSGQPFVYACPRGNMESFLESHVKGFEFLGGVTKRLIFDNGKVAVKEGYGVHAKEQAYYTAFRAHYAFDTQYCNPGKGNEKGLVEGLVGWMRRNILVPVPRVESLEELNTMILERCRTYGEHHIRDKQAPVGVMLQNERPLFTPLPVYRYCFAKTATAKVNEMCLVRFDTNRYSAPATYSGKEVTIKGYANRVEIFYRSELVAEHPRTYAKGQTQYRMEHYLEDLLRKPRALQNAAPLKFGLPVDIAHWIEHLPGGTDDILKALRLFKLASSEDLFRAIRSLGYPQNPEVLVQKVCPEPPVEKIASAIVTEIKVKRPNLKDYDKILQREVAL